MEVQLIFILILSFLLLLVFHTFLFRNKAIKRLLVSNLGPLYYPRVKPLDVLLAVSINDLSACDVVAGYFRSCLVFHLDVPVGQSRLAIGVYLLTVLMAIGFGLCIVFLGRLNKWVVKIIKRILQRVIIFTSGIFFATFELPGQVRPFVTWNPILHAVELFRYSMNNDYPIPDISLNYLISCSILLLSFSLVLYRTNESLLLEANDD